MQRGLWSRRAGVNPKSESEIFVVSSTFVNIGVICVKSPFPRVVLVEYPTTFDDSTESACTVVRYAYVLCKMQNTSLNY